MQIAPSIACAPWSETTSTAVSSSKRVEQLADLVVEVLVVAPDHVGVAVIRLVLRMGRVEVAPERVVDPVDADLDHHEEVPRPRVEQMPGDGEVLLGHLVDLGQDAVAVVAAEVAHVGVVRADERRDLGLAARRIA